MSKSEVRSTMESMLEAHLAGEETPLWDFICDHPEEAEWVIRIYSDRADDAEEKAREAHTRESDHFDQFGWSDKLEEISRRWDAALHRRREMTRLFMDGVNQLGWCPF
jgi:hypothetical protein